MRLFRPEITFHWAHKNLGQMDRRMKMIIHHEAHSVGPHVISEASKPIRLTVKRFSGPIIKPIFLILSLAQKVNHGPT